MNAPSEITWCFCSAAAASRFVGDRRYYAWMGALTVLCLVGLNAYAKQLVHGLITTA